MKSHMVVYLLLLAGDFEKRVMYEEMKKDMMANAIEIK